MGTGSRPCQVVVAAVAELADAELEPREFQPAPRRRPGRRRQRVARAATNPARLQAAQAPRESSVRPEAISPAHRPAGNRDVDHCPVAAAPGPEGAAQRPLVPPRGRPPST